MRIACLHTANSNMAVFDEALAGLAQQGAPVRLTRLTHAVRADLLAAAEAAGGLTPEIARQTAEALCALATEHDAVVLTCSTLGPAVDGLGATAAAPVLRVDGALAQRAVAEGGKVVALCAVQTTLPATEAIFRAAAAATGAQVEVRLVEGAWDKFKAGERAAYLACLAAAAEQAYAEGADRVALAQASMAGAAALVRHPQGALSSPACGLQAAMSAAISAAMSAARQ